MPRSVLNKSSAAPATIYDVLFEHVPSKSQRRRVEICEAAITLFAEHGVDATTYEMIADECDVTRPLVIHYFPERIQLLDFAIKYIRANLQMMAAVARQRAGRDPEEQIAAYVKSTFRWIENYRNHARVWLLFYYHCSFNTEFRRANSELSKTGSDRLALMILAGQNQKIFKVKDLAATAKEVQLVITGGLHAVLTEDNYGLKQIEELTLKAVFHLLGGKT